MKAKRHSLPAQRQQRGATLIEVLVSMIILMFGLLGLVGVMIQSQRAQLESYQRVQALMLVQDMASRMSANKAVVSCYVLGTYVGKGAGAMPTASSCVAGTSATQKARMVTDITTWHSMLLGSAESSGGSAVGSVLGARGCIKNVAGNLYQVSVAWQGSGLTSAPPAGITCGSGLYGDDAARRAVSLTVELI